MHRKLDESTILLGAIFIVAIYFSVLLFIVFSASSVNQESGALNKIEFEGKTYIIHDNGYYFEEYKEDE